ncbi:hypothetical protein KCP74_00960 [Salmonella enterica subsp. enterica]|nr:hypothetical protein KCP74_00960 [Salmonella enterica subsp. enterica]
MAQLANTLPAHHHPRFANAPVRRTPYPDARLFISQAGASFTRELTDSSGCC